MLQIQKLQDCLKAKRKTADPKSILDIVNEVQIQEKAVTITLTQKGIILELLAKVCYYQYGVFSKGLFMFYDGLKSGSFGNEKQKTTVKKKKEGGQRGNTTTVRKRKTQNPQISRHVMDLDEILEKELSTPNHTQKSQHSDLNSKQKERIQLPTIQRLEVPLWQSQQYLTPFKQIENQDQKENNLDQYRSIINLQSKNKIKTAGTNNRQQTAKTRKKPKNTQPIPQQINGVISIENTSQLSLRLEIQNVLQVTKKKKNKDKEQHNFNNHLIFRMAFEENRQILDKRQNIKKFYEQNYDKYKRGTTAVGNYGYSQQSNRFNFVNELDNGDNEYYENIQFNNKSEQILKTLNESIDKSKNVKFNIISQKLGMSVEGKASFFYDLLCLTEKYQLNQPQINKFGQISISMCKDFLF